MPLTTKVILYRQNRRKSRSSDIEDMATVEGVEDAYISTIDDDERINRSEFGNRIESSRTLTLWHRTELNKQDKVELDTTIDKPGKGSGTFEIVTKIRDFSNTDGSIMYMIKRLQNTQT